MQNSGDDRQNRAFTVGQGTLTLKALTQPFAVCMNKSYTLSSFLLIYHQLAFSSNLLQFTQNKKTQILLNNNLYKIKYIYYTDFLEMPLQAVVSRL